MNKMKLTYEKQSQLRHVNSSLQIKLTYLAQPDEFTGESPYLAAMTSQQYEISEFILQFYKATDPWSSNQRLVNSISYNFGGSQVLHPTQILPLLRAGYNPFVRCDFPSYTSLQNHGYHKGVLKISTCDFHAYAQWFQLVVLKNYYTKTEVDEIKMVFYVRIIPSNTKG